MSPRFCVICVTREKKKKICLAGASGLYNLEGVLKPNCTVISDHVDFKSA